MAKRDSTPIVSVTLKLRPTCAQQATFRRWLWHLTGLHNWAIKAIQRDAEVGLYPSSFQMTSRIVGHSRRLEIPLPIMRATVQVAHESWRRCFRKLARKPRLKGARRPLNGIGFANGVGPIRNGRVALAGIGPVRFHRQNIPAGHCGSARVVRRASGWYLCMFVKAAPRPIDRVSSGEVGIDPGFSSLLTLSTGEKVEHPHELRRSSVRLAQAQRGRRHALTARLHERIGNQRKNRNHHLSRLLVSENTLIAVSADNRSVIARGRFGKSVASSGHAQFVQQLRYKSLTGGSELIEVPSRNSTKTCSACGAISGPSGYAGLSVRQWTCACGASHDRDVNAAVNTLIAARGLRVESGCEAAPGIASSVTSQKPCHAQRP